MSSHLNEKHFIVTVALATTKKCDTIKVHCALRSNQNLTFEIWPFCHEWYNTFWLFWTRSRLGTTSASKWACQLSLDCHKWFFIEKNTILLFLLWLFTNYLWLFLSEHQKLSEAWKSYQHRRWKIKKVFKSDNKRMDHRQWNYSGLTTQECINQDFDNNSILCGSIPTLNRPWQKKDKTHPEVWKELSVFI